MANTRVRIERRWVQSGEQPPEKKKLMCESKEKGVRSEEIRIRREGCEARRINQMGTYKQEGRRSEGQK